MTEDQHLLCKIAEEASELAQRAMKAQQFGLHEMEPGQKKTNLARIFREYHDLVFFVEKLGRDQNFMCITDPEGEERRREKYDRFLGYSVGLGEVIQDS